jgi:UDP-N-acetylglucosamine--N-acetylmuramyl-(pentapeptide) pyrophosphoryl-undecaprenol N-acetylglucosamine transferase
MKVILTGGGTGGSVSPLLAIAEEIKKNYPETKFLFIGTRRGLPEKEMIKNYNFEFCQIFSGKLRRYFSWQNFLDIIRLKIGFWQSLFILRNFKPDLIIGAGGYVSVPVVLAGWFLKIPSIIHQQDIIPSLTNKILAPFAKKITVSFEVSLNDFPKNKTVLTGQPMRKFILNGDRKRAIQRFNLEENLPTLLVLGGGTGALFLNNLIWKILPELTKFSQIIHLTGKGKSQIPNFKSQIPNYHLYEFLTEEMADAYAVADLVISRAGINVLSELSVLGKPAIIIPIPDSHQEANAKYFAEKNAVVVLNQKKLDEEKLLKEIKFLIENKDLREKLSKNIKKIMPPKGEEKIVNEILNLL